VSKSQDDNTVVLGSGVGGAGSSYTFNTGAGTDTITLDPSLWNGSITVPSTVTTGGLYDTNITSGGYQVATGTVNPTWTTGTSFYPNTNTTVEINADGMKIKEGGDITIGGKSLSEAIEKIEERLGILHPNPALEERWDQLKELRRQYIEMEKDILEKEKLMKILKES
jgi:hypothetical protein